MNNRRVIYWSISTFAVVVAAATAAAAAAEVKSMITINRPARSMQELLYTSPLCIHSPVIQSLKFQ